MLATFQRANKSAFIEIPMINRSFISLDGFSQANAGMFFWLFMLPKPHRYQAKFYCKMKILR